MYALAAMTMVIVAWMSIPAHWWGVASPICAQFDPIGVKNAAMQ